MLGTVRSFDPRRGDGFVDGDNGESYYFHCVSIADGTRQISVQTRVVASRHVGLLGRDELREIQVLGALATRT